MDTLMYAKKLEGVGFSREQAEMTIEILNKVVESNLATKQDVKELNVSLRHEMHQGPRQVGKSFLAKNLLTTKIKNSVYLTLDKDANRSFASENPYSFLAQGDGQLLIVDEAQKSPKIFDEIKSLVDEKRTPGRFLILGSTEFSLETQIKESLTGRLSKLRLFPLCLAETKEITPNAVRDFPFFQTKSRVTRKDLLIYLENGGFPGIFAVKNESERKNLLTDWIKLTVERDLFQVKKMKLDSDVALAVLEAIADLENPTASGISKKIRKSVFIVQNHLKALKLLFVIFEVKPFRGSSGKPLYFLTDLAPLTHFGSTSENKILTWAYLEILTQLSFKGFANQQLFYFKRSKTTPIHIVYVQEKDLIAVKVLLSEKFDQRDYMVFNSFTAGYKDEFKTIRLYALYGGRDFLKHDGIKIRPYESII